jgi:hypothetical protein
MGEREIDLESQTSDYSRAASVCSKAASSRSITRINYVADIFLSYASKDRERISSLVSVLEQQGWSVWWDRKIPPGKTYDQVIEQALEEARCIVVVWSQTSVKSEWVKVEADEGMNRNSLVPILIEEAKIPLTFRRIQAARLVDWAGDSSHPELAMLFESIKAIIGEAKPKEESIRNESQGLNTIKCDFYLNERGEEWISGWIEHRGHRLGPE